MGDFGWRLSDLLFKLKLKQERIDALESGEEYVRMREQQRQELAYQDRIIKDLQKTLAEKDRQITENRKNWEQVYGNYGASALLWPSDERWLHPRDKWRGRTFPFS